MSRKTNIVAKEIAERKRAEEKLLESQERLGQIIDGNSIPTFVLDKNHRITHWNKALARLSGLSSNEAVGQDVQWKPFYAYKRPTMADLILEQAPEKEIQRFYSGKYRRSVLLEDSYEVEDVFKWAGKDVWLFFTAAPLRNRAGKIIGAVETLQDITARKEMEQKILTHQGILEDNVQERTLQLKKTYEQLLHAEKLSAVGKLAASIAHEFGNPIIGIRNFLKGLKKTATMDEDDSEMLDLAIEECQRVKDLISNLQNFNRPTSGVSVPMDIHKAVDDMLLFCKKSFKEKNITVTKRYLADIPLVNAVVDQIKQVILNCLNNAQESISSKGDKSANIKITTEISDNHLLLHIQDSGKGIKDEDLVYIFEPFFSTKPAVEGTGLGLSVSYGIMKKHQGNIEVTETSAHGTTFTLSLPLNINGETP
jgi:PAS domain S-box-containing protein